MSSTSNGREPVCELVIAIDGSIRFLWDDCLAPLLAEGEISLFRASHVEPVGTLWYADLALVDGPILGPFLLRADALAAEAAWLLAHVLTDLDLLKGDT
jgi:hypothetical protein